MSVGIRTVFKKAADQVITSSTALVTSGLTSPIAANETQKFEVVIPFSVGATGGFKCQVVVPAGGVLFNASFILANTVAPGVVVAQQVASAAFGNAVANAGNHWLKISGTVKNGATAGNLDIQVAQNSSDALSLTVLSGATMEICKI